MVPMVSENCPTGNASGLDDCPKNSIGTLTVPAVAAAPLTRTATDDPDLMPRGKYHSRCDELDSDGDDPQTRLAITSV